MANNSEEKSNTRKKDQETEVKISNWEITMLIFCVLLWIILYSFFIGLNICELVNVSYFPIVLLVTSIVFFISIQKGIIDAIPFQGSYPKHNFWVKAEKIFMGILLINHLFFMKNFFFFLFYNQLKILEKIASQNNLFMLLNFFSCFLGVWVSLCIYFLYFFRKKIKNSYKKLFIPFGELMLASVITTEYHFFNVMGFLVAVSGIAWELSMFNHEFSLESLGRCAKNEIEVIKREWIFNSNTLFFGFLILHRLVFESFLNLIEPKGSFFSQPNGIFYNFS
ncbi:hypothetical protein TUBRATIS_006580 [Tubulinosema ratisbonensis]|uniref:Uncharacterized protein n=1 Tax=Tubulinosema ratisbonensis TaxID=291195 RepID=A0A437AP76_9MICR|nr:hypothetical protein TUBRATIS_006580 [Tubulinosema ratisbonensis]